MNVDQYYDEETLKKVQAVQKQILKDVQSVCEKNEIETFLVFGSALGVVRHQGFIPWDDDIDVGVLREDFPRLKKVLEDELGDKYEFLTCETNPAYACTVTHFQKKGTKFVSRDVVKCDYVPGVNIDFFVYDHLADGRIARKIQFAEAWFWGRLLFLSGKGTPFIPYTGRKKKVAEFICMTVRKCMKFARITPLKVYHQFQRVSQRYNYKKTEHIASFEPPKSWLNATRKEDMYPLKKMKFDEFEVYVPGNVHEHLKTVFGDYMQLPPEDKRMNHRPVIIELGD